MRKQTLWLITMFLAVIVLLLVLNALTSQYAFLFDPAVSEIAAETNDRDVLAGNTELKIPASATEIHGYVDGFRDVTTYLRFNLPARDFETFLEQTGCTLALYQGNPSTGYSMRDWGKLKWWRPEDARQFQACADGHKSFEREYFIDTTAADQYLIYVVASTY